MTETEFRPQREPLVPPGGIELFARDMTATISGDVPLEVVQQKLGEVGQWLPIDGDPGLPVGRLVEMNSTGPLRLGYGAWRDLLLGCQFTNGRGELITAGGRTMKNVAGYDLTKLMVGQQGILGKIVTITTRTYSRPSKFLIAVFEPEVRRLNELIPTPCKPQWVLLHRSALVCRYIGDDATIAFMVGALPRFHPRLISIPHGWDEDIYHRVDHFFQPLVPGIEFRASVPPMRIRDFVEHESIGDWVADPAFGLVRGNCPHAALPSVQEAAASVGGRCWPEDFEGLGDLQLDPVHGVILNQLRRAFGT